MDRIELYIFAMFVTFLLHQAFNISFRIKNSFKIVHKEVKVLDCYPCFSFWLACLTFDPFVAMAVFLTASLIDRK